MLSLVPLEKQDFKLVRDYYNPNNQILRVVHPDFQGRGGWVLLYTTSCPLCQDTKHSWFAVGVVKGNREYPNINSFYADRTWTRKMSTHRFPKLQFVTKDGLLVNNATPETKNVNPEVVIDFACQNYGKLQGKLSCCVHTGDC
jgi:hypothetical protein